MTPIDRILRGDDVDVVLREEEGMFANLAAKASNTISGLKNFSFGSGVLGKLAGNPGSAPATTKTPVTGSTTAPMGAFGGKSMADLAQDAARSQGRGTPPAKSAAPATAPATKPATEGAMPRTMGKAGQMTQALKTSARGGASASPTLTLSNSMPSLATEMINRIVAGETVEEVLGEGCGMPGSPKRKKKAS